MCSHKLLCWRMLMGSFDLQIKSAKDRRKSPFWHDPEAHKNDSKDDLQLRTIFVSFFLQIVFCVSYSVLLAKHFSLPLQWSSQMKIPSFYNQPGETEGKGQTAGITERSIVAGWIGVSWMYPISRCLSLKREDRYKKIQLISLEALLSLATCHPRLPLSILMILNRAAVIIMNELHT
jgi:hypothetical protein